MLQQLKCYKPAHEQLEQKASSISMWIDGYLIFDEDIKKNMENDSKVLGNMDKHILEMSLHHHLSIHKKSNQNELKT